MFIASFFDNFINRRGSIDVLFDLLSDGQQIVYF